MLAWVSQGDPLLDVLLISWAMGSSPRSPAPPTALYAAVPAALDVSSGSA